VCAPYYMRNFYQNSQGIEAVNSEETMRSRKMLKDGRFIIERNGEAYTFSGQKIQ